MLDKINNHSEYIMVRLFSQRKTFGYVNMKHW
jgi:hypothetical protein